MERKIRKERKNMRDHTAENLEDDVIQSGFEGRPGMLESLDDDHEALRPFEEQIVRHTVDGKTWNTVHSRKK